MSEKTQKLLATWWALKIIALLHDPPWKPWTIASAFVKDGKRAGRVLTGDFTECRDVSVSLDCVRNILPGVDRVHEEEAIALIYNIVKTLERGDATGKEAAKILEESLRRFWHIVRRADILASTFDRVLLDRVYRDDKEVVRNIVLVNIFNPRFSIKPGNPDVSDICTFVRRLLKIVEDVCRKNQNVTELLRKLYFAFYALLEPYWYRYAGGENKMPPVPPADTRLPHHTVFDHVYATVMAMNMVEKPWILIRLDVPGIQDFISRGRKTRDFWAGSWLLSYLMWKIIEPVVKTFGPDVVISPALSLNPFYVDSLRQELQLSESNMDVFKDVPILGDSWPSQPVMPATVTLILPLPTFSHELIYVLWKRLLQQVYGNEAEQKLRELLFYIDKSINEKCTLSALTYFIRDLFEKILENTWSNLINNILDGEHNLLSELRKLIEVQCISNNYCEENDEYCIEKCANIFINYLKCSLRYAEEHEEYTSARTPVFIKVTSVTSIDVDLEINRHLREVVERVQRILSSDRECEQYCGSLKQESLNDFIKSAGFHIALLLLASREKDLPNTSLKAGTLTSSCIHNFMYDLYTCKDGVSPRLRPRYCSVCGVLPAVVIAPRQDAPGYARFSKVLEELSEYLVIDEGEALCPYCLLKRIISRAPVLVHGRAFRVPVLSTSDVAALWDFVESSLKDSSMLDKMYEEVVRRYKRAYIAAFRHLEDLLSDETFSRIVGSKEIVEKLSDVLDKVKVVLSNRSIEEAEGIERPLYLAYVRGDGDSVGKYWRGIIKISEREEDLRNNVRAYLENIYKKVWEKTDEKVRKLFEEHLCLYNYLLSIVNELAKRITGSAEESTVVLTPSYVFSLSRSLMVTSLIDATIVSALGGVLVFAGGDDVASLMPVVSNVLLCSDKLLSLPLLSIAKVFSSIYRGGDIRKIVEKLEEVTGIDTIKRLYEEISASRSHMEKVTVVDIALLSVLLSRMNYWGLLNRLVWRECDGFHLLKFIVVPALILYGRSYGLFYAHYKDPMWSAYRISCSLEEIKDEAKFVPLDNGRSVSRIEKDVVSVLCSRTGPCRLLQCYSETLPLSIDLHDKVDTVGVLVRNAIRLGVLLGLGSVLSKSLLYDVDVWLKLPSNLNKCGVTSDVLARLFDKLISRNCNKKYINDVLKLIDARDYMVSVCVEKNCVVRDNQKYIEPLVVSLLRAVRHSLSAMRREKV